MSRRCKDCGHDLSLHRYQPEAQRPRPIVEEPQDCRGHRCGCLRYRKHGPPGHLHFYEEPNPGRKTQRWQVYARHVLLGVVAFHPPWRRYTFHPQEETLFDAECLSALSEFCELRSDMQRRKIARSTLSAREQAGAPIPVGYCSVCREPQEQTIHGRVCANGHGGAPTISKEQAGHGQED